MKENAQTSKRYQRGFEPGLSRLRVRHSTTEPPRWSLRDGDKIRNEYIIGTAQVGRFGEKTREARLR